MNTTDISTSKLVIQGLGLKDSYSKTFLAPAQTFVRLVLNLRKLRFGLLSLLNMAGLYTCVYTFLYYCYGRPYMPWLHIASEKHYLYSIYVLAPSILLALLLSILIVHLTGRVLSGKANFKCTLATFALSIGVASWENLIHDYVTSFLGAMSVINVQEHEHLLNSSTIW